MKLLSWNVNGLRACNKENNFENYVKKNDFDFICLQETKISEKSQINFELKNYFDFWNNSKLKKGYSGTAIFCKKEPLDVMYGLNDEDVERTSNYFGI